MIRAINIYPLKRSYGKGYSFRFAHTNSFSEFQYLLAGQDVLI